MIELTRKKGGNLFACLPIDSFRNRGHINIIHNLNENALSSVNGSYDCVHVFSSSVTSSWEVGSMDVDNSNYFYDRMGAA